MPDDRTKANRERWSAMPAEERSEYFRELARKRARSMSAEALSAHGKKMRGARRALKGSVRGKTGL